MEQEREQAPTDMPQWFVQYALDNQRQHHELGLKIAETNQRIAETNERIVNISADLQRQLAETNERIANISADLQRQLAETNERIAETNQRIAESESRLAEKMAAQTRWTVGLFGGLLTLFLAAGRLLG